MTEPETARKPSLWLFAMAGAVVLLDRVTKVWAESALAPGEPHELIGSLLKLRLIYNPGAAFSMFTGATWVFAVLSSVFCVAVVWFAPRMRHRGVALAVGAVLGGAFGNLVDRLTREPGFGRGLVVDFLELPYWPVFNVADMGVFLGVCALVWFMYRGYELDGSKRTTDE